jgi:hypothetical protein
MKVNFSDSPGVDAVAATFTLEGGTVRNWLLNTRRL